MKRLIALIFFIFLFCLMCSQARPATYYTSPTGTADDGVCATGDPCSLSYVNGLADDDDIVVLKDGTYSSQSSNVYFISPSNSGSSGHPITFQADTAATPIIAGKGKYIAGNGYGLISALDKDYINITGITVQDASTGTGYLVRLTDCDRWVFDTCTIKFTQDSGNEGRSVRIEDCTHLYFIDSILSGQNADLGSTNVVFNDQSSNTLFDGCTLSYAYHNILEEDGWSSGFDAKTVFVDCTITNPYHTGLGLGDEDSTHYMVDSCTFYNHGSSDNPYDPSDQGSDPAIAGRGHQYIIRKNTFYANSVHFVMDAYDSRKDNYRGWVYHNTMYNANDPISTGYLADKGVMLGGQGGEQVTYGHFVNNIVWKCTSDIQLDRSGGTSADDPSNCVFSNNVIGDPSQTSKIRSNRSSNYQTLAWYDTNDSQWSGNSVSNPNMTDPDNQDFTIASGSALEGGRFLATVVSVSDNGANQEVTLGTNEGYAFFDGWGFDSSYVTKDTVYAQDGASALMVSVDAHNQITVVGNGVFAGSDTLTVIDYVGAAPDIGANEYAGEPQHTAPLVVIDNPGTQTVTTGDTVCYESTVTTYDGATVSTYLWDFDGQDEAVAANSTSVQDPDSAPCAVHTETGTFNQSLKVTDTLGASTTENWTLIVQAADAYDDCSFFERFEGDPQNAYRDYSAGDDDLVLEDEAVLHADAAYKGSKGLKCVDGNTTQDRAHWDTNVNSIYDSGDFAVAFAFKATSWDDETGLFLILEDAAPDYIFLELYATNNIRAGWSDTDTTTIQLDDGDVGTNTWYVLKYLADPSTNQQGLYLYSGDGNLTLLDSVVTTAATIDALAAIDDIWSGNSDGSHFASLLIDNLVFSLDHDDPVEQWVELDAYPKGNWLQQITATSADGTYGENDTIQVQLELNPLCGGAKVNDDDAGTDNDTTLSSTLDGGGPLIWSADSEEEVVLLTHLYTATVGAGQTEADLEITSLVAGTDSFDFDTTLPTSENLDDNAAIVIDTTAATFDDFYLCDSAGDILSGGTQTYTSGSFYIALEATENIQFKDGPLGNLAPVINCDYQDITGYVYSWTNDKIVFKFDLLEGSRCVACVFTNAALPHGATKVVDTSPGENELSSYNYPADGGEQLDIAVSDTFTFDGTTNFAARVSAIGLTVALDKYKCTTAGVTHTENITLDNSIDDITIFGNRRKLSGTLTIDAGSDDNTIYGFHKITGAVTDGGSGTDKDRNTWLSLQFLAPF